MKLRIGLYYIFFFLITLFKAFEFGSSSHLYLAIFAFGCTAVLIKVCSESYTLKQLIAMVIVVAIGLLNWLIGGFSPALTTAVALCGLKDMDINKLIKMSFWIRLFAFITMILFSVMGIIDDEVVDFYRNGEIIQRYTFGYGHPNTAHMMFAVIVLLSLYLYGQRMNIFHFGLIVLCNQILFTFTGSRTGTLILWIAIICHGALHFNWTKKVFLFASKYIYIVLFCMTLVLGYGYGKSAIINALDLLLTGRLYYINLILTEEVPVLFGHADFETIIVDNGYMELLFNGGILVFIWFSYYIVKISNKLARECRYRELLLIVCFIIFNMAESSFEVISVNVSLLFISEILFGKKVRGNFDGNNAIYTDIQPGMGTQRIV